MHPDQDYEDALTGFVKRLLGSADSEAFRSDLESLSATLAWFGALNSISMILIKYTAAGVPDLYQGNELMDLSLVDPDNRRPVDYAARSSWLDRLDALAAGDDMAGGASALASAPHDGGAKLWTTWRLLDLRRQHPVLFREGGYTALQATGSEASHVVAYTRDPRGSGAGRRRRPAVRRPRHDRRIAGCRSRLRLLAAARRRRLEGHRRATAGLARWRALRACLHRRSVDRAERRVAGRRPFRAFPGRRPDGAGPTRNCIEGNVMSLFGKSKPTLSVADLIVQTLADIGVQRIWGVTGDSLNAINDSLRRLEKIDWMHVRNEEAGAFAAGAEAAVTGELAVCAGSCGPGHVHLINGLYDCQRNHVPVLAIAAHIPSSEIGLGYFQETHPTELFRECSHFCEMLQDPAQLPELLHRAIRTAIGRKGVAVLVIPGDVSMKDAPENARPTLALPVAPRIVPDAGEIEKLATLLNDAGRVTLLCGAGTAGAHAEVVALAGALQAPIVHAFRGKEHIEWDNPFDVGMTGLIGFSSGYHAMMECDTLLMLGTDFPIATSIPRRRRSCRSTATRPRWAVARNCRSASSATCARRRRCCCRRSARDAARSFWRPRSSTTSARAKASTNSRRHGTATSRSIRNTSPAS